jgi:hypothetical protein
MKKSQNKPGEKEKPRHLTLSRETIQVLNNPALLKAGGGTLQDQDPIVATTSTIPADNGGC